jgi:hypothetical protein
VMLLYEVIIWIGLVVFISFIIAAVLIYFESEKFDNKYKKNIELIRAIKTKKLRDFVVKYYEKETSKPKVDSKDGFPTIDDFREVGMEILKSNKNTNRLMKKSADLKMWYDYLPRAKDFLVSASFWLFLLGLSILVFCMAVWAEYANYEEIRFSGYLSFLWIIMGMNFFKNILRYNLVRKNIDKHMDMIREGDVDKF